MASPVIRFSSTKDEKLPRSVNIYQDKTFPVANLLYTDTPRLPDSLSSNAVIYTTDTGEMFIGAGFGKELKPVTNKVLEKKINDLKESVYTKAEIDAFIENDINLDGIIDRLKTYTAEKADELLAEKGAAIDQLRADHDSSVQQLQENIDNSVQQLQENIDSQVSLLRSDCNETFLTKTEAADVYCKRTTVKNFSDAIYTKVNALESNVYSKAETEELIATACNEVAAQVLEAIRNGFSQ